jgi:hypothetical protein
MTGTISVVAAGSCAPVSRRAVTLAIPGACLAQVCRKEALTATRQQRLMGARWSRDPAASWPEGSLRDARPDRLACLGCRNAPVLGHTLSAPAMATSKKPLRVETGTAMIPLPLAPMAAPRLGKRERRLTRRQSEQRTPPAGERQP